MSALPLPMLPVTAINVALVVVSNSINACLECLVSYLVTLIEALATGEL